MRVLRLVAAMGGRPKRILLVGCEPTPCGPDEDPPMELSIAVQAAVDQAVTLVESLAAQLSEGCDLRDVDPSMNASLMTETIQHESS